MTDPPPHLSWTSLLLVTFVASAAASSLSRVLQPIKSKLAAVVGDGSLVDEAVASSATYSPTAVAYFDTLNPNARVSPMICLMALNAAWYCFVVATRSDSSAHWRLGFAIFMCSLCTSSITDARAWSSPLYASQSARMRARRGMIDGIIVPPLSALWAASTGSQAIWRFGPLGIGWLFVVVYACQSVIWLLLFCRSLQESVVALGPVILLVRPASQ